MTKEEIIEECNKLLFEKTLHLTESEYIEVLEEIRSSIDLSLDSLDSLDFFENKD